MMNFLRLIRYVNLIIIALTMYSVRFFYFFIGGMEAKSYTIHEAIDFSLLVFSILLIAAAGNIINDYFDVKADRINRPERLIISKHIKRRWAIILHWTLNAIAFGIGIYLSARYQSFWYVFIDLLLINCLWFYSMYFKRKALIGNILVALMTASIPIICGIHFYLNAEFEASSMLFDARITAINDGMEFWKVRLLSHGNFIYLLSVFAFTLNLSREIVKDMQDVTGDKLLHANTLPIVYGIKKTGVLAGMILLITPIVFIVLLFTYVKSDYAIHLFVLLPISLSILISLWTAIRLLFQSNSSKHLVQIDRWIKIAMLLGILLPVYWYFMQV